MKIGNDYYSIAMNDLKFLTRSLDFEGGYNQIAAMCQQVAEKALKSVVEIMCVDAEENGLLKSHSIHRLCEAIAEVDSTMTYDYFEAKALSGFYYDARYPGNNFVWVKFEQCQRAVNVLYSILTEINRLRSKLELPVENFEQKSLKLEVF